MPIVREVLNCWKKPREMEVTVRDPWFFQTVRAS